MPLNPELLKQLIETFKVELEEQTQVITTCLLSLEKTKDNVERQKIIETIFRASHNIKGAARSIGIETVGEIAHRIETLFTSIQKNIIPLSSPVINLSLDAVDKMNLAMQYYIKNEALPFNLETLLTALEKGELKESAPLPAKLITTAEPTKETIRVSIENLDKISALMEEMQVTKIAIGENYNEMSQILLLTKQFSSLWKQIFQSLQLRFESENNENLQRIFHSSNDYFSEINSKIKDIHKKMNSRFGELSILSNSLQEEIRFLRLIPAATLIQTFPRYIRDLSQQLNKNVELRIKGDEVKMDKVILDGLKDPIIHLLRNSIDHGIEDPKTRLSLGKPEVGIVTIEIKEQGDQIHLTISDDGAGINTNQIAKMAEQKNLISKKELTTMSENEILQLIFKSGFSSKETITDISGRGIGLDVVKSNLSELKGQIQITSEMGKGTCFHLFVPLTLSSERGLLIKIDDNLYAIPTHSVHRVLSISINDIAHVEGTQAIIIDNHTIPLRKLSDTLGLHQETSSHNNLSIVVIKNDLRCVAFLVDEIIGEREIVVKPLHPPLNRVPCVAGGTLLESNQVIVVLNSNDLLTTALHRQNVEQIVLSDQPEKVAKRIQILVVDDSITTRTLEKNILESKNYEVTTAVNGKEAWEILQKQKFSLMITDVAMPIMDGFTLTEQVKQHEKLRDLPVIIVTSLGSDAEKKRGIDVGADAYIVKNEFESGTLLEMVAQLI